MASVPDGFLSSEGAAVRDPLVGVPEEARTLLWQGFVRALDPVVWMWEQTPAGTQHALPPRVLKHVGERFNDAVLPGQQWLREKNGASLPCKVSERCFGWPEVWYQRGP